MIIFYTFFPDSTLVNVFKNLLISPFKVDQPLASFKILAMLAFPTSISYLLITQFLAAHFTSLHWAVLFFVSIFRRLPFAVSYKDLRWFLVVCILSALPKRLCC